VRDVSRYAGLGVDKEVVPYTVQCYLSSEAIDSKYRQPELCVVCFVYILQYGVYELLQNYCRQI
jgi:hypothetical protein